MRIKLAITLAAAISAALTMAAHAQTTYYVNGGCGDDLWTGTSPVCVAPNGPKRTIQAGIDASVTTDTVIVADGTYTGAGNRDLDFAGRDIHLRSESLDPSLCIIDCQGSVLSPHRGFYFHSGETAAAMVEGFTITNGFVAAAGNGGGGMLIVNSSPTVTNCTFSGNVAGGAGFAGAGGAMFISNSSSTVTNCTFSGNIAATSGGGMATGQSSSVIVTNCTFNGNMAQAEAGGGMATGFSSTATVTNCSFNGNSAGLTGGGMDTVFSSTATVTNCTFNGNTAATGGGMTTDLDSSAIVTNCRFIDNRATTSVIGGGGMINRRDSRTTIINCLFSGNMAMAARAGGGGVKADSNAITTIINCMFSDNTAPVGGGIYTTDRFGGHSVTTVDNTIAWGNTPDQIRDFAGATTTVNYSDVQGVWSGAGSNNIALDPLFVTDPTCGDLYLSPGSPCIDAGNNSAAPSGVDLCGNPRFVDDLATPDCRWAPAGACGTAPIVDMGAYEFPGEVCYADCDGNGTLDIFDFLCFQNSFVAGEPYACDCDPDPACDIFDFLCFQSAFVAGCP